MAHERKKLDPGSLDTLKTARNLYENEGATEALERIQELFERVDHPAIRRFYCRLLVHFGRDDEAKNILTPVIRQIYQPGFWELGLVNVGISKVVWSPKYKFMYFPVPKCGSTSVKNVFRILEGDANRGEGVHDIIDPLYRWMDRKNVRAKVPRAWRFAIVRDPMVRVRSYFRGNIEARDALVKAARGRDSYYGLSTRPAYAEFLDNFDAYKRVFITVRQHVMPLCDYLGTDPSLFHWLGSLEKMGSLMSELATRSGAAIPNVNEMRSPAGEVVSSSKEDAVRQLYGKDYQHYGRWF